MEAETVICDVCGFTAQNYGSTGTRTLRCSGCVPEEDNGCKDAQEEAERDCMDWQEMREIERTQLNEDGTY